MALSQISPTGNDAARRYFAKKVSEGKTKSQALVCLRRHMVTVVYMMLKHNTEYDAAWRETRENVSHVSMTLAEEKTQTSQGNEEKRSATIVSNAFFMSEMTFGSSSNAGAKVEREMSAVPLNRLAESYDGRERDMIRAEKKRAFLAKT